VHSKRRVLVSIDKMTRGVRHRKSAFFYSRSSGSQTPLGRTPWKILIPVLTFGRNHHKKLGSKPFTWEFREEELEYLAIHLALLRSLAQTPMVKSCSIPGVTLAMNFRNTTKY
jgi:hypothetical protein